METLLGVINHLCAAWATWGDHMASARDYFLLTPIVDLAKQAAVIAVAGGLIYAMHKATE